MAVTIDIFIAQSNARFVRIRASTIGELKQRIKGYSHNTTIYGVKD